jgi:hypothetical protein
MNSRSQIRIAPQFWVMPTGNPTQPTWMHRFGQLFVVASE